MVSLAADVEVVRACAACLKPLPPKQRAYCAGGICKQIVRLWRLKMTLAAARPTNRGQVQ